MNIEELEKQVQIQEDILVIENLQRIYGYYLDNAMWPEIIDLFSDEQTESVEIVDHGIFYGKKGVLRMYRDVIGGSDRQLVIPPWMRTIVTQIGGVIDISPDGTKAEGRWQTWLCENKAYGAYPRAQWLHGYYENKYVKENGKWFFSKLHWNNTFCTSVEDGWLNLPVMNLMPIPDADDPPSAFHPYPDYMHNVPYHYKHPITGE